MTIRVRESRFFVDIRHEGTRYRLAVPDDRQTRRGAEAYERAILADLAKGIDPRQPREAPTLAEYVADYLTAQETRCRPATLRAKKSQVANWIVPVLGAVRLDQVRTRHAEQLRDAMRGRKSGTTVNVLRLLGHVVKTWHRHQELPVPSFDLERFRDEETEPPHYSTSDVAQLLSAAESVGMDAVLLVLLGVDAGLRCGEVMALRWTDVRDDQLVIARSRDSYDAEGPTKSGRTRHVPLTNRLRAALASGSRDAAHVLHDQGAPLNHKRTRALLNQAQEAAGMEATGTHILRHTFCTALARAGVPTNVIAALAGHRDLRVTARYLHSCREDLTRGIAALGGGHGLGTVGTRESGLGRGNAQ